MKNQEKLLVLILLISVLFNIRQCSDSKSFEDERLFNEHELSEIKTELNNVVVELWELGEIIKEKKSVAPVKIGNKKPTSTKKNEIKIVDSVYASSLNNISDTTRTKQ